MILNRKNIHKKLKIVQFLIASFLLFLFAFFAFIQSSQCDYKNKIAFAEEQTETLKKKYAKAKRNCFLFKTTDPMTGILLRHRVFFILMLFSFSKWCGSGHAPGGCNGPASCLGDNRP